MSGFDDRRDRRLFHSRGYPWMALGPWRQQRQQQQPQPEAEPAAGAILFLAGERWVLVSVTPRPELFGNIKVVVTGKAVRRGLVPRHSPVAVKPPELQYLRQRIDWGHRAPLLSQ